MPVTKSLHTQMFEMDQERQKLALHDDLTELEKTYSGAYPEIEISTSKKWDQLANMSSAPEIRIYRLTRVSELISGEGRVLDIGPGWGELIPLLEKKFPNLDYTGIDFSENIVNHLSDKYPRYRFIRGSVNDVAEEQFAVILVLEVLEHIVPSATLDFLRQTRDRLAPGGELILTVPVNENLEEFTFLCGNCGQPMNKMGHVRIYSKELIEAELSLAGFDIRSWELIYGGYYGFRGALKRHLRNMAGKFMGPSEFKPARPDGVILRCVRAAE